jgi:D-beta-D-heptose 7-phosphate kinase/D-beta-D-heptose 1-phosphate adenosyltransferase
VSVKNILSNAFCLNDRYIPDYEELAKTIGLLRANGHSIVMTQGVYDLLHDGHTRYLNKAKEFGDILVVAVDSDEYTRVRKQRKNERRPAVTLSTRLELLANLRSVDVLALRDVDKHIADPYFVIKIVRPDVMVMSKSTSDVTAKDYDALREFCGRVEVLEPQAASTTSAMLRDLALDGASGFLDFLSEKMQEYFEKAGRPIVIGNGKEKH